MEWDLGVVERGGGCSRLNKVAWQGRNILAGCCFNAMANKHPKGVEGYWMNYVDGQMNHDTVIQSTS